VLAVASSLADEDDPIFAMRKADARVAGAAVPIFVIGELVVSLGIAEDAVAATIVALILVVAGDECPVSKPVARPAVGRLLPLDGPFTDQASKASLDLGTMNPGMRGACKCQ
jgi:hypothetical protein